MDNPRQDALTDAATIADVQARLEKLKQVRHQVLGTVSTARLGPETVIALEKLRVVQEKIRLMEEELAGLGKAIGPARRKPGRKPTKSASC